MKPRRFGSDKVSRRYSEQEVRSAIMMRADLDALERDTQTVRSLATRIKAAPETVLAMIGEERARRAGL